MQVLAQGIDNPYRSTIEQFFVNMFPGANQGNKCQIFEAVCNELFGTAKTRFGPMPNPESQVAIRKVVRNSIERNEPIPVLMVWGSIKPNLKGNIDLAEVSGLKTMNDLSKRVAQSYAPGLRMNLRIEDASGFYMFRRFPGTVPEIQRYCTDMAKLLNIMECDWIRPVFEAELFAQDEFETFVEDHKGLFLRYIESSDAQGIPDTVPDYLQEIGWLGTIPAEQREFYRESYRRNYHDISKHESNMLLSEYMTQSLAKHKLNATGANPEWGKDFIQLAFSPPVPGVPQGLCERRIHYRTLPCHITRNHLPPWRAKGYLRVNGEVKPSIASWGEKRDYNQSMVTISNRGESVTVQADYAFD